MLGRSVVGTHNNTLNRFCTAIVYYVVDCPQDEYTFRFEWCKTTFIDKFITNGNKNRFYFRNSTVK